MLDPHKDPKVLALLSAKVPYLYFKHIYEPYAEAVARYRARRAAYNDAYCMAWCEVYSKVRMAKAFYGVEVLDIDLS